MPSFPFPLFEMSTLLFTMIPSGYQLNIIVIKK
jgi:hypothetical protein